MEHPIEKVIKNGITNEILTIIKGSKSSFFNPRSIRFELFSKYGLSLRGRPKDNMNIYNNQDLKMTLSTKVGHVVRRLKKQKLIKKISNTTWQLIDNNFDINMIDLYSKEEVKLLNHG